LGKEEVNVTIGSRGDDGLERRDQGVVKSVLRDDDPDELEHGESLRETGDFVNVDDGDEVVERKFRLFGKNDGTIDQENLELRVRDSAA
jgi:hypothetical protein